MSKLAYLRLLQVSFFALALVIIFNTRNDSNSLLKDNPRIAINAETLSHLVLGFKVLAADGLWIRLLQEIDYKDKAHASKGWAFQFLDGITTLDPRYRVVYSIGLTALSVLVQDVDGAKILFERALINYPRDWVIAYRAAYHFLFEVRDCKRAAELFSLAGNNGAPSWLMALSSRLYVKTGQYEIAHTVLADAIERFKDTEHAENLRKRLRELEAARDSKDSSSLVKDLDCQVN